MSIGIFLDDERNPKDVTWVEYETQHWNIVRTYEAFKATLNCLGEHVSKVAFSFDHDLQDFDVLGRERTGKDCMYALIKYCMDSNYNPPSEVYFHTQNVVGKLNMESYYKNYKDFVDKNQ